MPEKYQIDNVSQTSSVDGPSPRGFVNKGEAMKSLDKSGAWALLVAGMTACATALAADFHLWYYGPGKAEIGMVIGAAVVFFGARRQIKRLADQGGDLNDSRN
jgi:hypothetical protein